jgi:gas vesicle protein
MPTKDNGKHPIRPSQHHREEYQPLHIAPEHHREQGPSTRAQLRPTRTHPKYSDFHPKPQRRKTNPQDSKLAKDLSQALQSNIEEAANQFSAQIVQTANELVNNASDTVQSDLQQAAGAIGDAIQNVSDNIEEDIENAAVEIACHLENQAADYLTAANIEKAAIRIVHSLAHAAIGAQHLIMSSNPSDAILNDYERDDEEDPLLPKRPGHEVKSYINVQHWLYPDSAKHVIHTTRDKVRHWLCSKVGHYFVLGLVGLDVAGIVACKPHLPPIYPYILLTTSQLS